MLLGNGTSSPSRTRSSRHSLPSDPAVQAVPRAVRWRRRADHEAARLRQVPGKPAAVQCLLPPVRRHPGGAEIEILQCSSPTCEGPRAWRETMPPAEFSRMLSAYYRVATDAIREPGGLIDKLLGDGVMALFIRGFAGADHAAKAVAAAV